MKEIRLRRSPISAAGFTALGCAFLFTASCSTESSHPPVPSPSPVPDTTAVAPQSEAEIQEIDELAVADSIERVSLPATEGGVTRSGTQLRIQLLGGGAVTFTDDTIPGDGSFEVPRYAGYLKEIRSHVVHRLPYEGSGSWLILDDSTGDSTIVFGMPVVSPDSTRFVVMSAGWEADYDPTLIEVWRMVGRKPEKEFSLEPPWQPSDPMWRASDTVAFTRNTYSPSIGHFMPTPARLIRADTTWIVSELSP